jgi:hypothetical protein
MKIQAFWYVPMRQVVNKVTRYEGLQCFIFRIKQSTLLALLTLKTMALKSFER